MEAKSNDNDFEQRVLLRNRLSPGSLSIELSDPHTSLMDMAPSWRKEFAGHWVERGFGGVSNLATLNRYF